MSTIKGPKGKIIAGNLLEFREDPLQFLDKLRSDYKDVAKVRFANRIIYVLMNPDLVKEALVTKASSFEKSNQFKEIMPLVGEGLLTSEGDVHMRQRRMMQPSFKKSTIQNYAESMSSVASKAVEQWQNQDTRSINVDMMNIALGIICKTMFSMDVQESHESIGQPIDDAMHIATKRIRSLIRVPYRIPTSENKRFKAAIHILDEVVYGIIEHRRTLPYSEYEDLLAILLKTKDETDESYMNDQQIRDEAMTIFLAGHETTANAMSWALYLLATHPEVQQKAQEEIDRVVGDSSLQLEHAEKLTYVKNIINESLRLFPPAWLFGRTAIDDVEIGDIKIKAGQNVLFSPYINHRSEEFFDQPNTFIPERFEGDFLKTIPPYAYFPFGGGPRVCIGNHFAMLEATIVLATVLQKFTVSPVYPNQTVEAQPLITLRPKGDLLLQVMRR
ncbi:cytochrome P450 [Bacillus mesophilus]|uniref:Cytochrome P450 n=1 Tax=Bacillus mesophilus TaxID=1808955 RepID=A0A6M0Q845_9BACI|nr:cytochrome P450 [Bacillus mesophilus]MBM7661785.1 cytochrome P450 [Bacillus mesophilus]NEY72443.1 cytochrome P450 [Bacillus mesophilus]